MPSRILARIVLVLFASSLAAAAGCGGGSSSDPVPSGPNEKQIKKEGGRIPGGPAQPKSK